MAEQEIVTAFDCGDEDLNGFILTDAPLYRKEKLAVTYTVFEKSNHQPIYINNVKALQIVARMSGGVGIFATYLQTYYISYNPYKEWNVLLLLTSFINNLTLL